jgi:hypothetical protein
LFWHCIGMDLKDILPEFRAFLRERRTVHEKSIPYYSVLVITFLKPVNKNARAHIESQSFAFVDGRLIACYDPRRTHHYQTYSGITRKDGAILNCRKNEGRFTRSVVSFRDVVSYVA